jgi:hypothetical protein
MPSGKQCGTCAGSGEAPTDYGPVDCPDCGGSGQLPSRSVLVDWRARDIERALLAGQATAPRDAQWLIDELRLARAALTEIIALAHDGTDAVSNRIRFAANRALGLYTESSETDPKRSTEHVRTVTL